MAEEIICLGKKFANEDERREYFRNELRKKLPELKKIDGFPIGEDEDIIALSDPPYFTSCPNPWLNEFLQDWENEKIIILNEGNRADDINQNQPYAADVSEGKKNPVYDAHSYHTKVPHPAIMRYILHYTQPGDIVFDGFAGTGMTGVAATICGSAETGLKSVIDQEFKKNFEYLPNWGKRKAICSDLSPIASFISSIYNNEFDLVEFRKEAGDILEKLKDKCSWLYTTKHTDGRNAKINYVVWSDIFICSECGSEIVFWEAAVDFEKKMVLDQFKCDSCNTIHQKKDLDYKWENIFDSDLGKVTRRISSKPVLIKYTVKKKGYVKKPDNEDINLLTKIETESFERWYPIDKLPIGEKTSEPIRMGIEYVHQFYTKRNLLALSLYLNLIGQSNFKFPLLFILTGMIQRSSKMNRMHVKNFFYGGGGWNAGIMKGTIHIPSIPIETSIIEQINDKINSFIKAKQIVNEIGNVTSVASATEIKLNDNSVDYIFTDPPFGANIMYSELNFLWESWLNVKTNNKKEAIKNSKQKKGLLEYQDIMTNCFKEYYRILKSGRWMTVEFSNTSAAVWNGIQTSIQRAGFVIANVSAIDKKQGGMRSITTPTAVKQDLAISCYKPLDESTISKQFDKEHNVWKFIDEHLKHLPTHLSTDNKTTVIHERSPRILYDRMISYFINRNQFITIDSKDFQQGLRQRFAERDDMFFTHDQVLQYDHKKSTTSNIIQRSWQVATESEGIDWLKQELKLKALKYQDIQPKWMQAITAIRKGDILPELRDILQQNFIEESDGSWRVPDMNEAKDREIIRNKALLKEFNGYIELANNPKAKRMKEVRVEALRVGFKKCWDTKDFQTIIKISDKIPQNLLMEDEQLLMFYDIAKDKI